MPPNGRKLQKTDPKMKEIIHSGHFMVSDIDDPEVQDGDDSPSMVVHESDCDQESLPLPDKGFDFESACKETSKTYTFGSRSTHSISIDASLTKLFECMTLAYSGKLTSPRWKQFKGLKLRLKEKIRLNNMIWRAWHMQFVMKIKTDKLCQFATPLDGDTHMKPEAIVIEGTYWKRRMANITAEYQKWRLFYRDHCRKKPSPEADNMAMDLDARWPSWSKDSYPSLQNAIDEDFIMDFSDTLFSSLNASQPFDFPNPREIAARAGIADFIQPGLVQLQPAVDDFMDTLEPITDLFSDFLNSRLPTLPEESAYTSSNSFQEMLQGNLEQQDLFGPTKTPFGRSGPTSTFCHSPMSSSPSAKRNNFRKPLPSKSATFQQQQTATPFTSHKSMMDNLNARSSGSSLLSDNVPLLNPEQQPQPSQTNSFQTYLCGGATSQSSESPTIVSLLQGNVQTDVNSLQQTQESLGPSLNMVKQNRTNQFFPQQTFMTKPFDETRFTPQPQQPEAQTNSSVQVPLQTLSQGNMAAAAALQNSSASEVKNAKHPLFFSLNQSGNMGPQGTFKIPAQVNSSGNIFQPSVQQQQQQPAVVTNADTPLRRHSYTTGQFLHVAPPTAGSGDYMSSRRSRPIVPATNNATFVVPEVPQNRQRTRSRSVSSPQSASPKSVLPQPLQAVSLTDISAPLQTVVHQSQEPLNKRQAVAAEGMGQSTVLPQGAVLAQLLTPACSQQSGNPMKVTAAPTATVTSSVTIFRPVLSTTAHTLVFSPVPLATPPAVSEFQRNILVGATSQAFANQNSPPTCVLPAPDSPGSSTCSSSPAISTVSYDSSQSLNKSVRLKSDEEKIQYKEHRRVCHINAEQKRRCNIKSGFESLHNLLPPLGQTPNSKVSKAAMLQRGAEYIRTLKAERQQQQEEADVLKKQIEELNQAINLYQSQLPASGAPIPCQRTNKMKEMFEDYVRQQTFQNWKFWIFSLIVDPLVDSFNNNVSTASVDEMCKSILTWLDQHCSLVALRPGVLNSLRHLSTTTNILSDPSCMPEEAIKAVTKKEDSQH